MHAGSILTSDKISKTWNILRDGLMHTGLEIQKVTGSICVGTDVAALRRPVNGCKKIDCKYITTSPETGSKIYGYKYCQE